MDMKMSPGNESRALSFWEGRIEVSTYKTYRIAFRQFMRWLKENGGALRDMSPDGLIEYQKNSDNGTKYDLLDLVQTWSQGLKTPDGVEWRLSSKKGAYSAVRSFFAHNRAPLPRDPYTLRSETPDSEGTLTIENIRDVCLASKPVYRAIFLSMFQGALDIKCFLYWNEHGWEDLQEALRDPYVDIVKIKLPKRKMNRKPFYTFIGADAIKAIRDYLPSRPTEEEARTWHEGLEARRERNAESRGAKYVPKPFNPNAIFYSQYKTPLQKVTLQHYWIDHLDKLGLVKRQKGRGRRYGKNLHEMRDVFASQWTLSGTLPVAREFFMGHKGDPLGYDKAYNNEDWSRDQYLHVLPMLEIMSEARPYSLVKLSPEGAKFYDMLADDPEVRNDLLEFLNARVRARKKEVN